MDIKDKLKKYIDLNLNNGSNNSFKKCKIFKDSCFEENVFLGSSNLNNYLEKEKDENKFQKLLFKYIDFKNLKDSEVYNKVNIDRRLFSKIRSDQEYHPSKETVILLSLSLELNEDELVSLLNSASYSLPKNNVFDLIIRFCFKERIYDVNKVNELLFEYNCKTLN